MRAWTGRPIGWSIGRYPPTSAPVRRLYFIVPDGADSVLTAVQQNLTQLREAEALGEALSPHLLPTPGLHDFSQEMTGIDDPAVALPPQAAAAAPPPAPAPPPKESSLSAHLQHLEPDGVMPFEFSALEALLMTACTELHTRAAGLQTAVRDALLSLRQTIGTGWRAPASQQLEAMRDLKQQERVCVCVCVCMCRACAVLCTCGAHAVHVRCTCGVRAGGSHLARHVHKLLTTCYLLATCYLLLATCYRCTSCSCSRSSLTTPSRSCWRRIST